jgi:hypothetical protein
MFGIEHLEMYRQGQITENHPDDGRVVDFFMAVH